MLSRDEYSDYCKRFKAAWRYIKSNSKPQDEVIRDICVLRTYYPERMSDILKKAEFVYNEDLDVEKLLSFGRDLALVKTSDKAEYRLKGLYTFPVKDMLGNVIALIGWHPSVKYITTPSKMFSKEILFYGMEQLGETGLGKTYVLVEGIFDSLSVRSLGIPCVAQMGITSSRYKEVLYSMFKRVLAIPDNDTQGREVIAKNEWNIPSNSKYLKWVCGTSYIKDIDQLCNEYEADSVREMMQVAILQKDRIINVDIWEALMRDLVLNEIQIFAGMVKDKYPEVFEITVDYGEHTIVSVSKIQQQLEELVGESEIEKQADKLREVGAANGKDFSQVYLMVNNEEKENYFIDCGKLIGFEIRAKEGIK